MRSYLSLALIALTFFVSVPVNAQTRWPFKIETVECQAEGQKLELIWDSSKSQYISEIKVNGKDEKPDSRTRFDTEEGDTFYKEGVFSIHLPAKKPNSPFENQIQINGKTLNAICTNSVNWEWHPISGK